MRGRGNQHFKAAFLEIEHCISRIPWRYRQWVVLSSTDATANSVTMISSVTETFLSRLYGHGNTRKEQYNIDLYSICRISLDNGRLRFWN